SGGPPDRSRIVTLPNAAPTSSGGPEGLPVVSSGESTGSLTADVDAEAATEIALPFFNQDLVERAREAGASDAEIVDGMTMALMSGQGADSYAASREVGVPHHLTDAMARGHRADPARRAAIDEAVAAKREVDTLAADYGPNRTAKALSAAGGDAMEVREGFERFDEQYVALGYYTDAREAGASHEQVLEALHAIPDGADHTAGVQAFIDRVEAGAPPVDEEWVWHTNNALAGAEMPVMESMGDGTEGSMVVDDKWVNFNGSERDHDLVDGQLLQAADMERADAEERNTGIVTAHLYSSDGLEHWHIVEVDRETGVVGAWHRSGDEPPVYEIESLRQLAKRDGVDDAVVLRDQDWKPTSVEDVGCAVHAQQAERVEAAAQRVTYADYRDRPAGEIDQAFDVWTERLNELGGGPAPTSDGDLATMQRIGDHAEERADELVPVLERQGSERASTAPSVTPSSSTSMGLAH
ncbi:MAG: hypothetical protein KDB24_18005, partial [Microthrixaceae bacterium]|nr:hypothetical protein [Microthrixaceae bacterium]